MTKPVFVILIEVNTSRFVNYLISNNINNQVGLGTIV